jgi:alpha-aminoadipic semialdehyde synthase
MNAFQKFRLLMPGPKHRVGLPKSMLRRGLATSTGTKDFVLGVMRETYDPWERRAPLCPSHIEQLLRQYEVLGKVIVQPSHKRIFTDRQYEEVGAVIQDDLSEADWILGVKRPKNEEDLIQGKAYSFFSHVIKGQPENMSLLKYILDHKIQLFDYECIVEGGMHSTTKKQHRLVAFGKFAGMAGTNDTLHALGRKLLHKGFSTPFLNVPPTYSYSDWKEARRCLQVVAEVITKDGLPMEPIVFSVTGKGGKVHGGVMAVLEELPHQIVSIEELPSIIERRGPHHCVYVLSLAVADLFINKRGVPFVRKEYQQHPDRFTSIFKDKIAPYTTVLVNTSFWNERFPRLLTKKDMKELYEWGMGKPRLQVAADISCDINGSIEFLHRSTSIERPFFSYDPIHDREIVDDVTDEGVTVVGVDILPSELPKDSSQFFGDALSPFVAQVLDRVRTTSGKGEDAIHDLKHLPVELRDACITNAGGLMKGFKYIKTLMARQPQQAVSINSTMILSMEGHLFDSGLINQSLDVIEGQGCTFDILDCLVRRSQSGTPQKSLVVLRVTAADEASLGDIQRRITTLASMIDSADANVDRYETDVPAKPRTGTSPSTTAPAQEAA